jgi:hypothetical protein
MDTCVNSGDFYFHLKMNFIYKFAYEIVHTVFYLPAPMYY